MIDFLVFSDIFKSLGGFSILLLTFFLLRYLICERPKKKEWAEERARRLKEYQQQLVQQARADGIGEEEWRTKYLNPHVLAGADEKKAQTSELIQMRTADSADKESRPAVTPKEPGDRPY